MADGVGQGARSDAIEEMLAVLREIKSIADRWTVDVGWSTWDSASEMIDEIDAHVSRLEEGDLSRLRELNVLFLPTGDLGEVALSSGWSRDYLELSARFDRAYGALIADRG